MLFIDLSQCTLTDWSVDNKFVIILRAMIAHPKIGHGGPSTCVLSRHSDRYKWLN